MGPSIVGLHDCYEVRIFRSLHVTTACQEWCFNTRSTLGKGYWFSLFVLCWRSDSSYACTLWHWCNGKRIALAGCSDLLKWVYSKGSGKDKKVGLRTDRSVFSIGLNVSFFPIHERKFRHGGPDVAFSKRVLFYPLPPLWSRPFHILPFILGFRFTAAKLGINTVASRISAHKKKQLPCHIDTSIKPQHSPGLFGRLTGPGCTRYHGHFTFSVHFSLIHYDDNPNGERRKADNPPHWFIHLCMILIIGDTYLVKLWGISVLYSWMVGFFYIVHWWTLLCEYGWIIVRFCGPLGVKENSLWGEWVLTPTWFFTLASYEMRD